VNSPTLMATNRNALLLAPSLGTVVLQGRMLLNCFESDVSLRAMLALWAPGGFSDQELQRAVAATTSAADGDPADSSVLVMKRKMVADFTRRLWDACDAAYGYADILDAGPGPLDPRDIRGLQHRVRTCLERIGAAIGAVILPRQCDGLREMFRLLEELDDLRRLTNSVVCSLPMNRTAPPPDLNATEWAVYLILKGLAYGEALTGKEIVQRLKERGIDLEEITLRRHVMPNLKPLGVVNKPGRGYFLTTV
jgi:hypothetical protein